MQTPTLAAATESVPVHVLCPAGVHTYWHELLRRAGIAWRALEDTAAPPSRSVLFLPEPLRDAALVRVAQQAFARGAAVVACAEAGALLYHGSARRVRRRRVTALAGSGPLFDGCGVVRLHARVAVAAGAGHGRCLPGGGGAVLAAGGSQRGPRFLLALPLPDAAAVLHARPRLHAFPLAEAMGDGGGSVPHAHEIVSACAHGAVRRLVENALRLACFARRLPFVRLGAVPAGHHGGLALRIDADGFAPEATEDLLQRLAAARLRATWFVDVERHLQHAEGAAAIAAVAGAGHDVQSHFWRHYTYRTRRANRRNLRRSLDALRALGVAADAAAAPFGSWHEALHEAMCAEGLRWSSEFSRLGDDLPALLPVRGGAASAWQVPAHPLCPAVLANAGLDAVAIERWFTVRLRENTTRGEPAVFYAHPIDDVGRCPGLLARLRAEIDHGGEPLPPWHGTLSELWRFHVDRAAQAVELRLRGDLVEGETRGPADLWLDTPCGRRLHAPAAGAVRVHLAADQALRTVVIPAPAPAIASGDGLAARLRLRLRHARIRAARLRREVARGRS